MNYTKETENRYRLENQNGLNNALYDYYEATDNRSDISYSKKEIRRSLQNWPTSYPCKITIDDLMFEGHRIHLIIESI